MDSDSTAFCGCWTYVFVALCTVVFLIKYLGRSVERLDPKGKHVLITGCDTGFGRLSAERLCRQGATVIATVLDENSDGARHLRSLGVHVIRTDVTKEEDVQECLRQTRDIVRENGLWALVNNAGVCFASEIELTPPLLSQKMIDVNYSGVVRMTQAFTRLVRKAQGRLIFISSMSAVVPAPLGGIYASTKIAVSYMAVMLREEMKKWNVQVKVIEPMLYTTPIVSNLKTFLNIHKDTFDKELLSDYGEEYFKEYSTVLKDEMAPEFFINRAPDQVAKAVEMAVLQKKTPWRIQVGPCAGVVNLVCYLTSWTFQTHTTFRYGKQKSVIYFDVKGKEKAG